MATINDVIDAYKDSDLSYYSPTRKEWRQYKDWWGGDKSLSYVNENATGVAGLVNSARDRLGSSQEATNDWSNPEDDEETDSGSSNPGDVSTVPTSPSDFFPGVPGSDTSDVTNTGSSGEADYNPIIEAWRTGDVNEIEEVSQDRFQDTIKDLGDSQLQNAKDIVTSDSYQEDIDQTDLKERLQDLFGGSGNNGSSWNPEDIIPEAPEFGVPQDIEFDTGIEEASSNVKTAGYAVAAGIAAYALLKRGGS
jgi:hypothetical protein